MAIPDNPDSRQRMILRLSVFAAVAASSYALALWGGVLPEALRPEARCPPSQAADPCPICEALVPATPEHEPAIEHAASAATAPPPAPAPTVATAVAPPNDLPHRFSVCDAPTGAPVAEVLALSSSDPPAIGVHCGTTVHVIAFDRGEPRRIAVVSLEGASAAASGYRQYAGALLAADVSGDGAIDLLAGSVREDEHGSPRGGGLYELVRAAHGGFEPLRLLAPLAVGALRATELDGAPGADLAVLRLEEPRLARGNEVLLLRGGPAPVKLLALPAGVGVNRLAAADLDLDERTDLVLAAAGHAPEVVFLGPTGQAKQRNALATTAVETVLTGDLNGDGHADALLTGSEAGVILASGSNAGAIRPLPALNGLESVDLLDWNGDGRLDVLGIREHTLFALLQMRELEFEAHEITPWPDRTLELHRALPGRAIGSPLAVVLIASPVQAHGRAELIMADKIPTDVSPTHADSVPDAPLCQRFSLP